MEKPDIKPQRPSTLTINGRLYDAASGQPLDSATRAPLPKTRRYGSFDVTPAARVHGGPARSTTLRRAGLAKPMSVPAPTRHTRTVAVATHPSVSRFGRTDAHAVRPSDVLSSVNADDSRDRPAGMAAQVQNYSPASTVTSPAPKPRHHAEKVSDAVRAYALAQAPSRAHKRDAVESSWKKFQRRVKPTPPMIAVGGVILALIVGAVCYLTVPALSLFVAAKSAGVEATYPGYVPDGYHFKGPVTYHEGDVTMTFKANGSDSAFSIDQRTSPWDSGAVLDNYVLPRSANYLTYSQGGITIYTFGSQAAWMNAGVFHSIDGGAQLTSDQILHIAGSM